MARGDVLGKARSQCGHLELIIIALVEKLRHSGQPAHATAIASQIAGAPIAGVDAKMVAMVNEIGVLDFVIYHDEMIGGRVRAYVVNQLGAEVARADIEGWEPSELEQSRRDALMASAQAGRMRS